MQAVFWAVSTDILFASTDHWEKNCRWVSVSAPVLQLYYIHTYKWKLLLQWQILEKSSPKNKPLSFLYTKQQFFQLDLETGLEIGADCLSHKQLGRVTQYSTKGQFRLRSIFHPFNYVISIKAHMGMMPNVNAVSGNQARVPKEKEFPCLLWT